MLSFWLLMLMQSPEKTLPCFQAQISLGQNRKKAGYCLHVAVKPSLPHSPGWDTSGFVLEHTNGLPPLDIRHTWVHGEISSDLYRRQNGLFLFVFCLLICLFVCFIVTCLLVYLLAVRVWAESSLPHLPACVRSSQEVSVGVGLRRDSHLLHLSGETL